MEWLVLIGRILYSMIFILFGLNHFTKLDAMAQYAASNGVPVPTVATLITGLMLVLGGLSVLLGYKSKIGSLLLVIFLVPTAFLMHKFWGLNDPMMASNQMAHFMKNLALAGSALLIYHFGTGPKSLE
ncbi:MAG: DoxX family protein [candidate division KSB1 bacterium]|nr:DoxX family protein [candidate division KSB1 bacterium]MDQ7063066.1 DoxX family protein [candidate division KSB1 bacterium]